MALYYFFIKILFFFGLVRAQIKHDPLKKHYLFLGTTYTLGVAFLYYVFFLSWQDSIDWRPVQIWIGITYGLSVLYFYLLYTFEEGVIFWTLLLLGVPLVLY